MRDLISESLDCRRLPPSQVAGPIPRWEPSSASCALWSLLKRTKSSCGPHRAAPFWSYIYKGHHVFIYFLDVWAAITTYSYSYMRPMGYGMCAGAFLPSFPGSALNADPGIKRGPANTCDYVACYPTRRESQLTFTRRRSAFQTTYILQTPP